MEERDYKREYMMSLHQKFPNKGAAKVEIINLKAILELPRGTEHFISDIHGEYEPFVHLLKNSSGTIRKIINRNSKLQLLQSKDRRELATLIYYPRRYLDRCENKNEEFYKTCIQRVLLVLKDVTFKFTRSKVRRNLPKDYGYIIQEMLTEQSNGRSREHEMVENYFQSILENIIQEGCAEEILIAMSVVIRNLAVEQLHIVGDIFDRGPGSEICIDYLLHKRGMNVDIQYGNHDVLWFGAAMGDLCALATILRISVRYSNIDTLESYGIQMDPLYQFAKHMYPEQTEENLPKSFRVKAKSSKQGFLLSKMQKALFIIQKKLEHQIILDHPEYEMDHRLILNKIDFKTSKVVVEGKTFQMNDTYFPTIDPKNPWKLSEEEETLMKSLQQMILNSEKLQRHIQWFFQKGSMYKVSNNVVMFHACLPVNEDFTFTEVKFKDGKKYKGKELMEKIDVMLRETYFKGKEALHEEGRTGTNEEEVEKTDTSLCVWLWSGRNSPLFGKSKMATFERYFIEDKSIWKEEQMFFFKNRSNPKLIDLILNEFGVDPKDGVIVVGHMPVKANKGEDPVRGDGRFITIDGGISRAYRSVTGIGGYTLISDSEGLHLCEHQPFKSVKLALEQNLDLGTKQRELKRTNLRVKDTNIGGKLLKQIVDLNLLIEEYDARRIKQKFVKTTTIEY